MEAKHQINKCSYKQTDESSCLEESTGEPKANLTLLVPQLEYFEKIRKCRGHYNSTVSSVYPIYMFLICLFFVLLWLRYR